MQNKIFSAGSPLYLKNPRIANGEAPNMQIQDIPSVPKNLLDKKYNPIATIQAKAEQTNCLRLNPKNIFSV